MAEVAREQTNPGSKPETFGAATISRPGFDEKGRTVENQLDAIAAQVTFPAGERGRLAHQWFDAYNGGAEADGIELKVRTAKGDEGTVTVMPQDRQGS